MRKNGQFEEVEWEEALAVVAENFNKVKGTHGSDGLAFISSSKATNEESY